MPRRLLRLQITRRHCYAAASATPHRKRHSYVGASRRLLRLGGLPAGVDATGTRVDHRKSRNSPASFARARHVSSTPTKLVPHPPPLDRENHWGGMWGGAQYSTQYTVHGTPVPPI